MKETLRHREAFEYYYSLGEKRSYPKVASKFTVSRTSIKKWAKAFNWQTRIEQRDIENSKTLAKKTNKAVVNSKADYRALIKETVDIYKQKLKDGKIKVNKPQDLDTLAKLDLVLMGEANENEQHKLIFEIIEGNKNNNKKE